MRKEEINFCLIFKFNCSDLHFADLLVTPTATVSSKVTAEFSIIAKNKPRKMRKQTETLPQ